MGFKNTTISAKDKIELITTFKIVDMGLINFYLCIKIDRNYEKKTIKLFELIYI